jgi:hypothetical protein
MALKKYPRTFHLPWSQGSTDDDKTHSLAAIERMFGGREVVITEKMDGENTTIYSTGECHARSLDSGKHPSRDYVRGKAREIACLGFPQGWRMMGENLYAKHSIEYDLLPDYFVIFGVADDEDYSRPWDEVEEWASLLEVPHAPVVWRGVWDTAEVMRLYPFKSMLSSKGPAEGYVVRDAGAFPMSQFDKHVAKFVRSGHVQPDAVHWMHQSVTPNKRHKNPSVSPVLAAFCDALDLRADIEATDGSTALLLSQGCLLVNFAARVVLPLALERAGNPRAAQAARALPLARDEQSAFYLGARARDIAEDNPQVIAAQVLGEAAPTLGWAFSTAYAPVIIQNLRKVAEDVAAVVCNAIDGGVKERPLLVLAEDAIYRAAALSEGSGLR